MRTTKSPTRHKPSWAVLGFGTTRMCRVEEPKGSFTHPFLPCGKRATYVINEEGRHSWDACPYHFQEWLDERKEKAS